MSYKGRFRPKNPQRYLGDTFNIIYRSSWELKLMMDLDTRPGVISWGSEEIVIPYRSPVDGRVHRYYPDFYIKRRTKEGAIRETVVEVKPKSQTTSPKKMTGRITKKKKRAFLYEVRTWGVNQAKWEAAENFCAARGWDFVIMTEYELGIVK